MDAVERRLTALETEVRKLRRRLRTTENDGDANLFKPIVARGITDAFPWILGYKGEQYETEVDYLPDGPYVFGEIAATDIPDASFTVEAYSGKTSNGSAVFDINAQDSTASVNFTLTDSAANSAAYVFNENGASVNFGAGDKALIHEGSTNWVDLTDGGATTLHSHAISGYTRVYHKANNSTSGTGPAATTSETSLGSFTVTGGDMGTTGILRVRMGGTFNGLGASTTVTIRVKFGSTVLYADASAANTAALPWYMELNMANVGSASAQRMTGFIAIGVNAATTGLGNLATDETLATTPIYGSASENTANDLTFDITAQLSDGTAGNSCINFSTVAELL